MQTVTLKPGRDKTARQRHPWIFSGALAKKPSKVDPGEIVRITSHKDEFIAYGYFNSRSQIAVRLLEWNENHPVDMDWWHSKIRESVQRRADLMTGGATDTCRLVFGEADFLPGLIVDKYAAFLVVQALTAGIERVKKDLLPVLIDLLHPDGIFERSDSETRALEGLDESGGVLAGVEPPELLTISENGLKFQANIKSGQKTAFYIDQRDNRKEASTLARGCHLLDCFSYSGAFSVYCLKGGAKSATLVDSSSHGLELARANLKANQLDTAAVDFVQEDVFEALRRYRREGRYFDMIILDPPKFAPTKSSLKKALSAYKDINLQAAHLLKPGGILMTFSCSGAVDLQTLQTVLFWASADSGRQIQILKTLSQGRDHPRLATFPESEYLKGFVCRIV
jgi:23S rRNA (cytosine1962-C5)-methyltransferase